MSIKKLEEILRSTNLKTIREKWKRYREEKRKIQILNKYFNSNIEERAKLIKENSYIREMEKNIF
ncbi:MAG: hypothetical protein N3G19_01720 [Candidatus Pacearchaeota archaeon]|nr:hypothetical protein [Candidatus Pacearchaeota archaeon]